MRRISRGRLIVCSPAFAAVLAVLLAPAGSAAAPLPVPSGYELAARTPLAPGVDHVVLRRAEPPLVVNVARIAPGAPVSLRAVLSNDQVAASGASSSPLERTSSMCLRVQCIVALNGDFTAAGSQEPLGGLVTGGRLLRSPSTLHHQLSVLADGRLESGSFEWSGTLVPTDFAPLAFGGVNVPLDGDGVVLYTPAFGASTPTAPGPGAALLLRTVEPAGPLRLGQTALVEIAGMHEDLAEIAVTIPAGGAVLAGRGAGAAALFDLWARTRDGRAGARALLRIETPAGVRESIGGTPILLRNGARWFADADDDFTRGRHPRTVVGWNAEGEKLLVTVDGRQPEVSVGMTLAEVADLLLALGATEAINLDGGGSTTFVAGGEVLNRPSDIAVRSDGEDAIRHLPGPGDEVIGHVERPVASALAVVPAAGAEVPVPELDPSAAPIAPRPTPQALALPAASSTDPGSVPFGGVPALATEPVVPGMRTAVAAAAIAANVAVALALAGWTINRRVHQAPALTR